VKPSDFVLRLSSIDSAALPVDRLLHMSVLRELMGQELREVLREELALAFKANEVTVWHSAADGDEHSRPTTRRPTLPGTHTVYPSMSNSVEAEFEDVATPAPSARVATPLSEPSVDYITTSLPTSSHVWRPRGITSELVCKNHPTSIAEAIVKFIPRCSGPVMAFDERLRQLGEVEAPERTDLLSRFADSSIFTCIIYSVILANCFFMTHAADAEIKYYDRDPTTFLVIGELSFVAAYAVEFFIKFYRHRFYFFCDAHWRYNWLDFSLLVIGIYTCFLEEVLVNVSWLRVLRIFRLAKALRVLRLIAMVKPLRVLLKSLGSTMGTLGWCLLMFSVILFLFALVFVLRVANYFRDTGDELNPDEVSRLVDAYGSVSKTMLTLYICSTGGNDWALYYEALQPTGYVNTCIFLLFVAFTQIAVLNIILGIFVDEAMKSLMTEKEEHAHEHAQQERHVEENLRVMCSEADVNNDGKLTYTEWSSAIDNYRMKTYLHMMGFRADDVLRFVRTMCKEDPEHKIDIDTFVRGCMHLKGTASCFDMQTVLASVHSVDARIQSNYAAIQRLLSNLLHVSRTCSDSKQRAESKSSQPARHIVSF
jgi:hypothetical protein